MPALTFPLGSFTNRDPVIFNLVAGIWANSKGVSIPEYESCATFAHINESTVELSVTES